MDFRVRQSRRLLDPLFRKVHVEPEVETRLRNAHAQGIVVHVFRFKRHVDPLFLSFILDRLGLPKPVWVHHHQPRSNPSGLATLRQHLRDGHSAAIFLRRPRSLMHPLAAPTEPYVETLLSLQNELDRPILLMPETLLATRTAAPLRRTFLDALFGAPDAPGAIREIGAFLAHHAESRYHVGIPVDLKSVQEREAKSPLPATAKKVRWSILNHLARQEQLRTGPMVRSAQRTRQAVMKDPAVRKLVDTLAKKATSTSQVERRAEATLKAMAADVRLGWIRALDWFTDWLWRRIYDGVVVDQAGLAKVRDAATRGPIVLAPSHKSHIDYLLLSAVFFREGLMPPHIAAGENLNFPPVGAIFRRGGAFFIRRGSGDKLYATLMAAYIRRLMKEGHALEFFIEGGRSRTGRLMPPKTGFLSMCVNPVLEGFIEDVTFIPVSIGYEKIIEADAYARELAGEVKQREDVSKLLSSTKLLRSKYGRVYVDFAEPMSLKAYLEHYPVTDEGRVDARWRRHVLTQLGHQLIYEIGHATRVTPSSLAAVGILAHRSPCTEAQIMSTAAPFLALSEALGARTSNTLLIEHRAESIREALNRFVKDGLLEREHGPTEPRYTASVAGRRALDYYRNNIIHLYLSFAVIATAVGCHGQESVTLSAVQEDAEQIMHLLSHEFSFRTDQPFAVSFRQAIDTLLDAGWLALSQDMLTLASEQGRYAIRALSSLSAPALETCRLVLEQFDEAPNGLVRRKFTETTLKAVEAGARSGTVAFPEGASALSIKSCLRLFIEDGVIDAENATLQIVEPAARDDLLARIERYLPTDT
jgi:glycerol-3-phosphate O-acyltransferase